ncbi:hypothetical protein ACJMK2_021324 [Sinanodonta woodiana]|uniref:Fucolectin tachylectin-4 pentraxin-1 domain-containing protein n=1 Tax=Sinanodonta woodiana TaxID=1069815 RepID=A0ABD3TI84_SINWO
MTVLTILFMKMPVGYWRKFLPNTTSLMLILLISNQKVGCLRNFALNKFAYQSSTIVYNGFKWTADKAVDGNTNGSKPENSNTCSATNQGQGNHTWEVDIGWNIIVKNITVYGRNSDVSIPDQLSGFQVFVGNSSNPWTSERPLKEQGGSSNNVHVFSSIDYVGRFVSVVRWNQTIMTLCEVTVEGECLDGVFSAFCNLTCGKCKEGRPCDKDNGTCPGGCDRGLKGTRCDIRCENGTYGSDCQEICGYCMRGNLSCSTIDGHCKEGCQEGWKGETCKLVCETGTYGPGCNEICGNCLNGSCSIKDGKCTGGCLAGYKGDNCKLGVRNLALNKFAYQSSTLLYNGFQWTADKAVDGNTNGSDPDNSRTCSATNMSQGNHTWEVDIGFQILIKTIIVYERTNTGNQLHGFQVFVGNGSNPWTSNPPLPKRQSPNYKHVFASVNSVGRYVSVVRLNQNIVTLCEVEVEGECLDGVFSEFCNMTCGNCDEARPCDKDSGDCLSGCDRGWKGARCDMRIQDTASTGINGAAIGGIAGTVIVVAVMTVAVVIAVVKWKRRRMKTTQTPHLGAIESQDKDKVTSEIYWNTGNDVSEGSVGYSKANANTALDEPSSALYEQLGETAQNETSVYTVINDATKENDKKNKVSSNVDYAQQLLSIEKEINAMEKKKNDLILKKRKLLKKLASAESIEK